MNSKIDRYTSAWAHVALCADTAWAPEPVDAFSRANQKLWYNHCHSVREVPLQQQQISAAKSNDSNVPCLYCTYAGRGSLRSVTDVIPQSRLAKFYGNFYYNEVRERCYTNEREVGTDTSSEKSDTFVADAVEECWMLPEVEQIFMKLTEDDSSPSRLPTKNQHEYSSDAAAESLWQSLRAPRIRACQKTQSTANCWSQSDKNVDGSVSRVLVSDCSAVHFVPASGCSCYSRAPGSGASYKLTYIPVNKDIDISMNRYEVKTQEEIDLKSRICSNRVRTIWPVAVKHPRDSRKIRTRHRPRPVQKSTMRRKSPHPMLNCKKPTLVKNILAHHGPDAIHKNQKQVLQVRQQSGASTDPHNLILPSNTKRNVTAQKKAVKLLNSSQKTQNIGVRIISSDQELPRKNMKLPLIRNLTPTRSLEMRDVRVLLEQLKRRADAARLLVNAPTLQKRTVQLPSVKAENLCVSEVVSMSQIVRSPPDGEESPKVSPNNIQKRLYSAVLSEKAQGDDGLDQLEREAIGQYKASDESIDTQYRELERQALEQYSGTSLRGGNEKTKNGKARRSSKNSKRAPRPRVHAGGDLPAVRAPV